MTATQDQGYGFISHYFLAVLQNYYSPAAPHLVPSFVITNTHHSLPLPLPGGYERHDEVGPLLLLLGYSMADISWKC